MVDSVVSFAIERLHDLLIEEARLLNGVPGQVSQMQTELKRMHCFLKDADRRQHEDNRIHNWIIEIRNIAYDAEDVIAFKVAYERSIGTRNLIHKGILLHKVGSKITAINSKISNLTTSLQTYGLNAIRDREDSGFALERKRDLRRSYSHIVEKFVVGLDEDINQLVRWLVSQDKHCRVVYISGMGGLGKTTLAMEVYRHSTIRRHFEGFAWAYVSQQCKQRYVWEGILLKLISPSKEERDAIMKMRDDELAKKLYEVQKEKQCLIIIDDIWSKEDWDILSPAFPSEDTCSKIVFTSRNKDIASHVDCKGLLHEPRSLNEEESWTLFQKKGFPRKDDSDFTISNDIEKLGKSMVEKCGGLPLAIIVLGGILAAKDTLSEWEKVHNCISSYLTGEVHEKQSKLSDVLELSYSSRRTLRFKQKN